VYRSEDGRSELFNCEHRQNSLLAMLKAAMQLQRIKMVVAASWMLITLAVAISAGVTWPLHLAIAAVGVLPPLALLLWWNEPGQTMTEAIDEIRRGR
jgi:hypothetical protein